MCGDSGKKFSEYGVRKERHPLAGEFSRPSWALPARPVDVADRAITGGFIRPPPKNFRSLGLTKRLHTRICLFTCRNTGSLTDVDAPDNS